MSSSSGIVSGAGASHSSAFTTEQEKEYNALKKANPILHSGLNQVGALLRAEQDANAQLGKDLAEARAAEDKATRAEQTARSLFNTVKNNFERDLEAAVARETMSASATITDLEGRLERAQHEAEEYQAKLKGLNDELSNVKRDRDHVNSTLAQHKADLERANSQHVTNRAALEATKSDLEHEKAAAADREEFLNRAYADHRDAEHARRAAVKARDEAVYSQKEKELEMDDLRKEWQASLARIDDLESQLHEIERIDEENKGLEADVERLQDMIADHERTLAVKDSRITELEGKYQKELRRNFRADAEAAAAAALPGSPINEASHDSILENMAAANDNLAAELDAVSSDGGFDELDYDHEPEPHLELSTVTDVYSYSPIQPASPDLTSSVKEVASVTPVNAPVPQLSLHLNEAGSVAPSALTPPTLTVNLNHAADTEPIERNMTTTTSGTQTETTQFTTEMLHSATFDVSPIQPVEVETPAAPTLTTNNSNMSFAAVQVIHEDKPIDILDSKRPTTDVSVQTSTTTDARPVIVTSKASSNKVSFSQSALMLAIAILSLLCISFYSELHSWRTANGVGYRSSYHRGGAYGNGRHLFGIIPIGMDIGNSWFSEQIARYAATAIMNFEQWSGVDNTPYY